MVEFEWIAHYKDKTKRYHKPELGMEFKYPDIDRHQIVAFELVQPIYKNDDDFIVKLMDQNHHMVNVKWIKKTYKRIFLMEIDPNKIFFYRKLPRLSLVTGEALHHLDRYLVGWKIIFDVLGDRGQVKQHVEVADHNLIYQDGHIETHAPKIETTPTLFKYETACQV